MSDRTALYRHWDADGKLLYVGVSLSAVTRLGQHRRDAGWADEIASVTIEYFATREAALKAEECGYHGVVRQSAWVPAEFAHPRPKEEDRG